MKTEDSISIKVLSEVHVSADEIVSGFRFFNSEQKIDLLMRLSIQLSENEWNSFLKECNVESFISDWVLDKQDDKHYHVMPVPREMPDLIEDIRKQINKAVGEDIC